VMGHTSILLYLCQKCYQGIIGNHKKEYFPPKPELPELPR
jgi:hypothetical protein